MQIAEANRGFTERSIEAQSYVLVAVIALTSTLLLAWLSFRFFESFFLNFKEKWTVRETGQVESPRDLVPETT